MGRVLICQGVKMGRKLDGRGLISDYRTTPARIVVHHLSVFVLPDFFPLDWADNLSKSIKTSFGDLQVWRVGGLIGPAGQKGTGYNLTDSTFTLPSWLCPDCFSQPKCPALVLCLLVSFKMPSHFKIWKLREGSIFSGAFRLEAINCQDLHIAQHSWKKIKDEKMVSDFCQHYFGHLGLLVIFFNLSRIINSVLTSWLKLHRLAAGWEGGSHRSSKFWIL